MLSRRRKRQQKDASRKRARIEVSLPWEIWSVVFRHVPPIYLSIVRMTCKEFHRCVTSMIDPPVPEIIGDKPCVPDFIASGAPIPFLEWVITQGCRWYPYPTHETNDQGHCIFDERGSVYAVECSRQSEAGQEIACAQAANAGQFEVLQWLFENGCPVTNWCCSGAAKLGRMDIILWLDAQGVEWNFVASRIAAKFGHLLVVQWSWDLIDDYNRAQCLAVAKREKHGNVVEWIENYIDRIENVEVEWFEEYGYSSP